MDSNDNTDDTDGLGWAGEVGGGIGQGGERS